MLKYILFALLLVIAVINFTVRSLSERLFKKEITMKEEIAVKLICFAAALVCVSVIIFGT